MNKLLKRALILGCIGFFLGTAIGFFMYCITDVKTLWEQPFNGHSMFKLLVGGLQGFLAMSTTVVYDIESWSIARSTFTHFVITAGGFFTMGYFQEWLIPGDIFFCIMAVSFVVVYFIIWLIQYLIYLHNIKQMNNDLEKMKKG
ncbi:MAG: DUF3021 domain-containing protein [Lachnospiraceae bacterium]|nr:DUF3021 domain-containing protein [Lachnospiraceae bacterium]